MSHRHLRGLVLGLMFFLAGTAFCSCDGYDPDPYDDVPPVVTVEFNYLLPGQTSIQVLQTASGPELTHASSAQLLGLQPTLFSEAGNTQLVSALPQLSPQMVVPLRR